MPYAICWACVFIKSCRAQAPYRPAGVMIHRPNGFPNPRSFLLFGGSTPVYICAMVQNENSRWRCQFGRQFLKKPHKKGALEWLEGRLEWSKEVMHLHGKATVASILAGT